MPEAATEEALNTVQRAFDKVAPDKLHKVVKDETPAPEPPPPEPIKEPEVAPAPKQDELKLPSFIEKATTDKAPEKTEDEIPPEPPPEIKDEKAKSNWKKLREKADKSEREAQELRNKLAEAERRGHEPDEATTLKLQRLEADNKRMAESLSRFGVETSEEFQAKVIRPMQSSYTRARTIVHEAGGDVAAFDKALGLTGRAQYEALDEVYQALPDSARRAADKALDNYRELASVRANALRNAPQTYEQIRKEEMLRQRDNLENQKVAAEKTFEDVVNKMASSGFELFQESKDPDTQWWNQIKPKIVTAARNDFLNATSLDTVAESAVAKHALPIVTELWRRTLDRAIKAEKELSKIRGSEPRLSESGGGTVPNADEDAKLPFEKLFIREVHKQAAKRG